MRRHLISIADLSPEERSAIFERASELQDLPKTQRWASALERRVAALLFVEPSTRTALSFQSAIQRLGGHYISNANTSMAKGESLSDTLRIASGYADLIVLRHAGSNTAELVRDLGVPVLNAGDDSNEHPTQALTDLFTIKRRYGQLSGITVGLGFDPAHSRSLKSFCLALSHFPDNTVIAVAPDELQMSDDEVAALERAGLRVKQTSEMSALLTCPIVYLNRFQLERHEGGGRLSPADRKTLGTLEPRYRLTAEAVERSAIELILNPLPRVGELDEKVDHMPQAGYFDQAAYGLAVRMALLEEVAANWLDS